MTTQPATLADRPGVSPRWSPGMLGERLGAIFRPRNLLVGLVVVVVAYLVLSPLWYLFHRTFFDGGSFTLDAFRRAYTGEGSGKMIRNSFVYAAGSTALAVGLATPLAFVYARTDVKFKRLLFTGTLVPTIMPAILYAPAWIYLGSPKIGMVNWALDPIFGHSIINVYSLPGMVWVEGTHLAPIAFLLMATAFRNMDPSLEESAQIAGLSNAAILRKVTIPLVRPALVPAILVVAVLALETFDIPVLIGQRHGIFVFTTQIYFLLGQFPQDFGAAGALGVGLLLVAAAISYAGRIGTRRAASYQTVTGKGFRPRQIKLGRARPVVSLLLLVYFFVTVVLPVGVLFYTSLLPNYQVPSSEVWGKMSFRNYGHVLTNDLVRSAMKNSTILGLASATVVMFLAIITSWLVVRTRMPGRQVIGGLSFVPLVIPGIVTAFAIGYIYLRAPIAIYGTLWILLIAYTTRFMPYAMRYAGVSMHQVGRDLEESAYVSGLSWSQAFLRVVIPLSRAGIFAGWIYVFLISFRQLGVSVLLYTPGTEVMPVLILNEYNSGRQDTLAALGVLMLLFLTALVSLGYALGAKSDERV